ncbi:MAG: phospholipase D-like domain-containing protein [Hydrogenimonas sp.]|nr:phospholipase D-like domain-containing protein [Hydrogenimonas sp.]
MGKIKAIFLIFAAAALLSASNIETRLYTLPKEAKPALKELLHKIDTAKYKIDAAIYSFTHKKIAKRLANAAKRGVKIRIIFDKESNLRNRKSQIGYLSKYRNIDCYLLSGKKRRRGDGYGLMHMKLMIIDNRHVVLGSANWTYSAFGLNHEVIAFIKSYEKAKKLERAFERMAKEASLY